MTESAGYVKVLVTFQRGVLTSGAESQHSASACAVLSLRLSLMCVVKKLASLLRALSFLPGTSQLSDLLWKIRYSYTSSSGT